MHHTLDLHRYPLDQPDSPACHALVEQCRADLVKEGMFTHSSGMITGMSVTAVTYVHHEYA